MLFASSALRTVKRSAPYPVSLSSLSLSDGEVLPVPSHTDGEQL